MFDASHNATLEIFHSEDLYFKGNMDKYDMIYPILFYKDMRIEGGFVPYRIHKKDVKTSTYKDYKIE